MSINRFLPYSQQSVQKCPRGLSWLEPSTLPNLQSSGKRLLVEELPRSNEPESETIASVFLFVVIDVGGPESGEHQSPFPGQAVVAVYESVCRIRLPSAQ